MSVKQLWRWQGVNDKGQLEQDVVWADNRLALIITLQHQRIMPLRIKRMGVNAALWKEEQSAEIIHQLATLIHAGLTLSEGLELLAKQHPHRQWQALLRTLAHELEQGVPFSSALVSWPQVFPPLYQTMIRTGELTGKLAECCFELARQQKAQRQITVSVKKALRYPVIILTMAALVVFAMLHFVLPEFAAIYRSFNTPLPLLTRGIIAIAQWGSTWGWLILFLTMLIAIAHRRVKQKPSWQAQRQRLSATASHYGSPDKRPETSANIHRTGINPKRRHSFSSGTGKRYRESRLPLLVTAFNAGTSGDRRGQSGLVGAKKYPGI